MRPVRPNLALLWPSFTLFPMVGIAVVSIGAATGDSAMRTIGVVLLVINAATILNHAYFTRVAIEDNELVHHSVFGIRRESVPLGSLQRIDAKRYPAAHSGVSAPFLVARGRSSTVKVNSKPYRLADLGQLIDMVRRVNGRVEVDPFWERVVRGEDVSKDVEMTPRSRW